MSNDDPEDKPTDKKIDLIMCEYEHLSDRQIHRNETVIKLFYLLIIFTGVMGSLSYNIFISREIEWLALFITSGFAAATTLTISLWMYDYKNNVREHSSRMKLLEEKIQSEYPDLFSGETSAHSRLQRLNQEDDKIKKYDWIQNRTVFELILSYAVPIAVLWLIVSIVSLYMMVYA